MIQKLRKQFIIIAMCSTLAVLSVIIGVLNFVNYLSIVRRTDDILGVLAVNDGRFPDALMELKKDFTQEPHPELPHDEFDRNNMDNKKKMKGFLRETPYETRYFYVLLDDTDRISYVDTNKIASVEADEAVEYAKNVIKKGNIKGFVDGYRYLVTEKNHQSMVIFVDVTRELQNHRNTFIISITVSFFGLLAVLILVMFFSKLVFRPVEESYRKQKQFITDASHELKTPLTIISANVEVLEMETEENDWTRSIKHQINRMVGMVEQMVTLSRMDEESEITRERFSMSDAVLDTVELFLPVAEGAHKDLSKNIQENIECIGDEKQIRQLVGLLLDNAIKYAAAEDARDNPQIHVTMSKKGRKVELLLCNTVVGLEPGNQDILFERFYRADSSRNSKTGGSGIGLSIAKSIVESHRGSISAVCKEGKTIEFRVLMPCQ